MNLVGKILTIFAALVAYVSINFIYSHPLNGKEIIVFLVIFTVLDLLLDYFLNNRKPKEESNEKGEI